MAACVSVCVRGEEPAAGTMQRKLHADLLASLPSADPPSTRAATAPGRPDAAGAGNEPSRETDGVITMEPFVVEAGRAVRLLEAVINERRAKAEAEKFKWREGGTITEKDIGTIHAKVGSWWTPEQGWTFLVLSKASKRPKRRMDGPARAERRVGDDIPSPPPSR